MFTNRETVCITRRTPLRAVSESVSQSVTQPHARLLLNRNFDAEFEDLSTQWLEGHSETRRAAGYWGQGYPKAAVEAIMGGNGIMNNQMAR